MELKDFISTTLVEIHQGIQGAISELGDPRSFGAINPVSGSGDAISAAQIANNKQQVDFDIAVTTTNSGEAGVQGGVKVVGINIGGSGREVTSDSQVTRVKFSVPYIPPITFIETPRTQGIGVRRG
tara:strand:- start:1160 stop:1537 length:378 start_codon:yes stop_codon:yes gene_type:complete